MPPTKVETKAQKQGVQSLEIGLTVALALADSPSGNVSLSELSRKTKMSPSKVHRYLVSLARTGIVQQDMETGRYDLAPVAIELGLAAQSRLDPIDAAENVLAKLHDEVRLPVAASIWTSHGPVIIRKAEAHYPLFIGTPVGDIVPIATSSIGRAFAAFGSSEQVDKLLEREFAAGAIPTHRGRPLNKVAFKRLLREAREAGVAGQYGDLMPGIEGIAAPVFNVEGRMTMALSLISLFGERDLSAQGPNAHLLLKAAADLSQRIGYAQSA